MGDLNNDGIPEIVLGAGARVLALHANNGSVYWNVYNSPDIGKHHVILDTDGTHYPYVYVSSSDIYNEKMEQAD
jgi:outer membrane protein assembly factor BamB